ncbi:hypothetical protein [Rossellomorea marisflavi]|uniref:hypothetical protein n=1 Tax=Rossellomorea marisflavi TaxID=189381 RepID=UPI003459014C
MLKIKEKTSTVVFKESLKLFKLSTRRIIFLIVIGILFYPFLKYLAFGNLSAVVVTSKLALNLNNILIPTFAVIITGYAIFQALASGPTLIRMISVNHGKDLNKFAVYNLYFFGLSIIYLILLIINFVILLCVDMVDPNWSLKLFSNSTNEHLICILITVYLLTVINFVIELKSFIWNLLQIFLTNGASAATEYLVEQKKTGK